MPETRSILWTFENKDGAYLFPQTVMAQLYASQSNMARVASDSGVMKRAYVPHDVDPIIGRFDNDHIPDATLYDVGTKYYNTSTNKICTVKESGNTKTWSSGTDISSDRILVDIRDNTIWHFHSNELQKIGGSSSGGGDIVAVDI